jgi:hypothetical protein
MPNKKINQLDTRTGAALTDLILIGDPTSGTSFKLTATDFKTLLNNVPYTGATTNVNLGAFNLTAASIIKSGGTSSQFLKADGSVDSSVYTPTSRTLTINGTSFDLSADRSWTIAAGITGSGASGQVAYWNGTSSQTGSNNLFWDAANSRLGIGLTNPASDLMIFRNTSGSSTNAILAESWTAGNFSGLVLSYTNTGFAINQWQAPKIAALISAVQSNGLALVTNNAGNIAFWTGATATEKMRLYGLTGNLVLQNGGTFTDGGQRLQVQGDAFIKGSGATSATSGLIVQDSASTQIFNVRNDGNVFVGLSNSNLRFTNNGGGTNRKIIQASWSDGVCRGIELLTNSGGDTTVGNGFGVGIYNSFNTTFTSGEFDNLVLYSTFVPTSGTGRYTHLNIRPVINQTGGANGITRGLYVNPTLTAAADWRSIETSTGKVIFNKDNGPATQADYTLMLKGNNPRLRLEAGTAGSTNADANIQFADSNGDNWIIKRDNANLGLIFGYGWNNSLQQILTLGIRSSDPTVTARGAASSTTEVFLAKSFAGSDLFSVRNNGNILVNTGTDAGFKLDVNGTARVSGATTLAGVVAINSTNVSTGYALFVNGVTGLGVLTLSNELTVGENFAIKNNGSQVIDIDSNNNSTNAVFRVMCNGQTVELFRVNESGNFMLGTSTEIASAKLVVDSTTQGLLPPRMTTTQKNAIGSPAAGLVVYDTDTNKLCCYNGTSWNDLF